MIIKSKYIVVEQPDIRKLEKVVNENIKEGYEPIGGIALNIDNDSITSRYDRFYQAMYLKD